MDFPFFKHGKKNKLAESFSVRFCDSQFYVKRKILYEFPQKSFKTTERHSLAVCSLLSGEKQFLLIFIPLYWFDKKSCLNKSKISLGFPLSNRVRKTNFLNFSELVSEIVNFMPKKKSSL